MIPKAITPELIRTSRDVFGDLSRYLAEIRPSGRSTAEPDIPTGLKQLQLIIDLDFAIHHGGLWGYFGDITNDDGSQDDVEEAIAVLRHMRAMEVAEILSEAWQVWREFLTGYLPVRDRVNKRFDEFQSGRFMRDEMEQQLDPLDDAYYENRAARGKVIGDYVRANPKDFVHPA